MTDSSPNVGARSFLRRTVWPDDTVLPLVSADPFNIDGKIIINDDEIVKCSGKDGASLTGCNRGIDGTQRKKWVGGTTVDQLGWTSVEIIEAIPDPIPDAMIGRQFMLRTADGAVYSFNVVTDPLGTGGRVDWVNEPPPDASDDVPLIEAIPRIVVDDVPFVGVYTDAAGAIFTTNRNVSLAIATAIRRYSAAYVLVYGNTFGSVDQDRWNHIYADGTNIFWVAEYSPTLQAKIWTAPEVNGTPAEYHEDMVGGIAPLNFKSLQSIIGDGTNLWVVDRDRNKVTKLNWSAANIFVWEIANPVTWAESVITSIPDISGSLSPNQLSSKYSKTSLVIAGGLNNRLVSTRVPALGNAAQRTIVGREVSGVTPSLNGATWYVVSRAISGLSVGNDLVHKIDANTGTQSYQTLFTVAGGAKHIATDDTSLWVTVNHTLERRLASTGALQATYPSVGAAASATDGSYNNPVGVAYYLGDSPIVAGVYVADVGNNRVQKITPGTGVFISKITGYGVSNATPFSAVHGVAVDQAGYIYILDYNAAGSKIHCYDNGHVWLFTRAVATAISASAFGLEITQTGELWIGDPTNQCLVRLTPSAPAGNSTTLFNAPTAITIGPGNTHIHVLDAGNGCIKKYLKTTGAWVATYDIGVGNIDGKISATASGLAIDADGNYWISDTGNDRIQVFDPTGVFLFKVGSFGTADDQFNTPKQISFNAARTVLWVADQENNRVTTLRRIASDQVQIGSSAYDWDEEFIGGGITSGAIGERGWTFTGNGSLAVQPSTAANPGLIRLNTGGTSGNKNRVTLGPWVLAQIDKMTFIGFFAANGVATSTTQRMGLGAGANHLDTFATDNGVCVEYVDSVSTGFLCVTSFIAGVANRTITAVPFVAAAPYMALFEVTAPGEVTVTVTQLLALGGGVSETVVKSGLSQTAQFDATFAERTQNGTSKFMDADYWSGSFSGLGRA
jgi:hypothetical protein